MDSADESICEYTDKELSEILDRTGVSVIGAKRLKYSWEFSTVKPKFNYFVDRLRKEFGIIREVRYPVGLEYSTVEVSGFGSWEKKDGKTYLEEGYSKRIQDFLNELGKELNWRITFEVSDNYFIRFKVIMEGI